MAVQQVPARSTGLAAGDQPSKGRARIRAIERAIAEQLGADLPRVASTVTNLRRAIDVAAAELGLGT
jgi:hypothetical protein